jgi:hypothetical protein
MQSAKEKTPFAVEIDVQGDQLPERLDGDDWSLNKCSADEAHDRSPADKVVIAGAETFATTSVPISQSLDE